MADALPKRFKGNNHLKRSHDAQEDAPEQKRAEYNHRPVKNSSSGVINLQCKTKTTSGNLHLLAKEWKNMQQLPTKIQPNLCLPQILSTLNPQQFPNQPTTIC